MSSDLTDQLQDLNDHLEQGTRATAVYIGKMEQPFKPISESDNDRAHIDKNAPHHIRFCHANKDHQFLVDQILESSQGLTFEVFDDSQPAEGDESKKQRVEEDDEGNPVPPIQPNEGEVLPKFIVIPEVVREAKMYFFKVPRLGSYMAIRLEYQTCLFEEAFDAGFKDMMSMRDAQRLQDEHRAEFERDQAEAKAAAEANGETFKPETRKWEEFKAKPYLTQKVQFVCCLNTMGQDRKFTAEEKLFALRAVQKFRDRWEASERENLKSDIMRRIAQMDADKLYRETCAEADQAELESRVDAVVSAAQEGQEPLSDAQRETLAKRAKFTELTKGFYDPEGVIVHQKMLDNAKVEAPEAGDDDETTQKDDKPKYYPLVPEQWKRAVSDLRHCYIVKSPRVLQTLFYLLGYEREEICFRGTNALCIKKARELINESLFQRMGDYKPEGSRTGSFKEYQKLGFLKSNIKDFDEEKLWETNIVMSKVLQWIKMAIDIRVDDVVTRRDNAEFVRQERQSQLIKQADRQRKYAEELEEKKAAFEEAQAEAKEKFAEAPEELDEEGNPKQFETKFFDEIEFRVQFDLENEEVVVVEEPAEEIDRDFDLPYKPPVREEE